MATFSTSEFKNGLKVLIDGEPCSILENEVVKPGKGQAFNRVRMRNLKNGRVWDRTAQGGTKPATLSSGAVVKVPLFVTIGDVLRVDTRTSEYQNRVNK